MQFVGSRLIMGTPNLKESVVPFSQRINLIWRPLQITGGRGGGGGGGGGGAHGLSWTLFLHQSTEDTISLPFQLFCVDL